MFDPDLKATGLYDRHVAAGARMVPFAGYAMPVQYPTGVLAEHRWTREHAGLFDVSHMGPAIFRLAGAKDIDIDFPDLAQITERLVCGDIASLKPGQLRYTLLLNEQGGIVDDLMIGRLPQGMPENDLYIVVNASTKDDDFARFAAAGAGETRVDRLDDHHALLALQGPEAAAVITDLVPGAASLAFMQLGEAEWRGHSLLLSRSGYTGEDGYEILVPPDAAHAFWDALLADERVKPIGLGARDSLRLEAGLPLYGHDLDESTSPVEGALRFAVSKRRREARDFPGADRILSEWTDGPSRVRVGLRVTGAPAREGAEIATPDGAVVGRVTSGGPSPSAGGNVAMGYVPPKLAEPGTPLHVLVRGRPQAAEVVPLPFVPHRYVRKV